MCRRSILKLGLRQHIAENTIIYLEADSNETNQTGAPQVVDGKIDINTATLSQLTQLPGIGEVLAQRIIDYRTENGPFATIEDIILVKGIGETRLDSIRDHITIGG